MKVALIDFDGTVVDHCFPKIGEPKDQAFEVLKELQEDEWKLILWTCREDVDDRISQQYLTDAVKFCRENGVEFDAINETLLDFDFRCDYKCLRRKPHARVVIDDSNLGGFPGWEVVRNVLILKKKVRWIVGD